MPGKRAGARSHRSFARQQVGDNLFNIGSCGNNHLRPSSILNHSSVEKLTARHWNTHSLCNKTWPPPSARNGLLTSVFLREFDEFIDTVHLLLGELLIMGDLNVHFDLPSKPDVAHVLASVSSADLVQVVTKPTYVHMDTYLIHLLPVWIPVLSIIVYIVTTIQTMLLSVLTLLSEALNVFQGLLRIDLMVTLTMVSLVLILPLSWLLY
ncbi:uncharacterized protein LOC117112279 isoform X1 [Anneissia japonica]|uniref:uncharacterized protein LOC117112279 isoform X1 n=1 Tax=Anneissia japonica TaxID=1529436 RepID=UPI001425B525|nr:uncharacterized protein LOC117112279 isoform X1 [Anneissia japonica]